MTIVRLVAVFALLGAGCGTPPAKRAEPRLGPAPRPRSLEPAAAVDSPRAGTVVAVPAEADDAVAIFEERELGDAVGLPIISARPAGALFTATTSVANPDQRPRAWLQVLARRDGGPVPPEASGFTGPRNLTTGVVVQPTKPIYTFFFVVRTTATPPIRLNEASTRRLLDWLDALGTSPDASACTIGDRSFTASAPARDRITCTWRDNRVIFDRVALADQFRRAFAKVGEWTHG